MADTTSHEESQQIDERIRSPFQLSKTSRERPVKLVSLTQTIIPLSQKNVSPTADLASNSSTISPAESTDSTSSRSSSISSNPFSLNIKKVSTLSNASSIVNGSLISSPTSTAPLTNGSSSSTSKEPSSNKVSDLQKELVFLKKDIEAKDAKLSSSVKSIKQFWSPELKKERASRKEETEKCIALKEKYQISQSQIEEYKSALEDLESEFKSQQTTVTSLNDRLAQECKQKNENDKSQEEIRMLNEERNKQDDEIFILTRTLDDFELKYKQLEDEIVDKNKCISDLEVILVDSEKKELNYQADKKELEILHNTLHEQEIDYQMIKKEYDTLKQVHSDCSNNSEEIEKFKDMITDLEKELDKQTKLSQCSREELEKYRQSDLEKYDKISELEHMMSTKTEEYEKVHSELLRLQEKLEESNSEVLLLQEKLQQQNSNTNDASLETIVRKDKEIEKLNIKYEKLDKYLSERENALDLCRDELKGVKTMNQQLRCEKETLENDRFEHRSTIQRMERQRRSFSLPRDDPALMEAHNELKCKYDELKTENEKLKEKLEGYDICLEDKTNIISSLEENLSEQSEKIKSTEQDVKKAETEKTELTNQINQLQHQIKEFEKTKISDDAIINIARDETSKKMLEEMTERDNRIGELETRIEDLESQLKEKTKQITTMKKNQTSERDKQHQLINESKKLEEEIKSLEEEKQKKDERIFMLEDALRESVALAVEREDLLAGHKEMYETAVNKMNVMEGEYSRVEMEKAITNIKNAFLILSLSEKDAFIASMEATKKRSIEELLNIKQGNLLNSISEKDNQIASLELQSPKNKKQEIKQLKTEKEKFVEELKAQNNTRMALHLNGEKNANLLLNELKDAPSEQVYEAIRHLSTSTSKLEFYIEELITFLREQERSELIKIPNIPRKKSRPVDKLKKLSKDELLKELNCVDSDCSQLKTFVHNLLDKLEGTS